ncbi:TonB family protein [Flagellimonas olearia]|uniref:TonB family protein n=1 Tax=Flagellimonas olearia TaxID=552546 RepID=A0A6I1DVV0_9FLAO|nr:M56 family metallopeptidase [Allomuricauda olearia]KAB7529100.1 TonB family protein [Allomuricauda olearia]
MITYILECLVFQLVFLLAYDLFLKKETFFQWNRVYLLVTFVLSLVLPWVKIEAFKTVMPQQFAEIPVLMYQLDGVVLGAENASRFWEVLPWYYWVMGLGSIIAACWLGYKLFQIIKLKKNGVVEHHPDFTKITVKESVLAFSFFRNIFLGGNIEKEKEVRIIAHELVHIKQWHSLDLLFFELARIAFWFNPLVYVYQNRMAELHEFIADAKAVKEHKKAHFQMLLSEAFQTQNISFVNQFFNQSLIKKRIVMLQKKKSKAIWQLKYVGLLPLVLGMLVYTSCENETNPDEDNFIQATAKATELSYSQLYDKLKELSESGKEWEFILTNEDGSYARYKKSNDGSYIEFDGAEDVIYGTMAVVFDENRDRPNSIYGLDDKGMSIPIAFVDEAPIFPGCEDAVDRRACFVKNLQEHIRKHFNYPKEAQEKGIQGRVNVIFIIDTEGRIVDIRKRGPNELLENEAVRIIEKLPQMQPGKQNGEAVNVPFSIPIAFQLENGPEGGIDGDIKKIAQRIVDRPRFSDIDEAPIFPGCEDATDKRACFLEHVQTHIRKHFNYPKEAQEMGIEGKVYVIFKIDANGAIADIRTRGPHELLEAEAERIIKRLPVMQPGKRKGEAVDVPFSIPITFKLQ